MSMFVFLFVCIVVGSLRLCWGSVYGREWKILINRQETCWSLFRRLTPQTILRQVSTSINPSIGLYSTHLLLMEIHLLHKNSCYGWQTLYRMFIVNASPGFKLVWNTIRGLLDNKTAAKINVSFPSFVLKNCYGDLNQEAQLVSKLIILSLVRTEWQHVLSCWI